MVEEQYIPGTDVRRWKPYAILGTAWLVALIYAFPGYMNFDAAEQLNQARTGRFDDWHPPLMAGYWRVLDLFMHGPFLMLLLQLTLFQWGLYAALRLRFASMTAAVVASCMMVFPPILTPMAPVWKDAQMAAFLIAGIVLASRERTSQRVAGCLLLVFAVGVRDNAAAALPPLLLLVTSRWFRQRLRAIVAAAAVFVVVTLSAIGVNRAITDVPAHPWYLSTAIHDIAGTICHAGPMDESAVRDATYGITLHKTTQASICEVYTPRVWLELAYGDRKVFEADPADPDRIARGLAWRRLVREHPGAYLHHRWAVTKEILGLTSNPPWEPVCQTFTATAEQGQRLRYRQSLSWIQKRMGRFFGWIAETPLYRPWIYLALALIAAAYVLRRDRFVLCVVLSGLLYEASVLLLASAPDFRYSHWMITCTCFALVVIFKERFMAGRATKKARGTRAAPHVGT